MRDDDDVFLSIIRVRRETERAWLVELDDMAREEVWLPKSVCELAFDETEAVVPYWLAEEKGLV